MLLQAGGNVSQVVVLQESSPSVAELRVAGRLLNCWRVASTEGVLEPQALSQFGVASREDALREQTHAASCWGALNDVVWLWLGDEAPVAPGNVSPGAPGWGPRLEPVPDWALRGLRSGAALAARARAWLERERPVPSGAGWGAPPGVASYVEAGGLSHEDVARALVRILRPGLPANAAVLWDSWVANLRVVERGAEAPPPRVLSGHTDPEAYEFAHWRQYIVDDWRPTAALAALPDGRERAAVGCGCLVLSCLSSGALLAAAAGACVFWVPACVVGAAGPPSGVRLGSRRPRAQPGAGVGAVWRHAQISAAVAGWAAPAGAGGSRICDRRAHFALASAVGRARARAPRHHLAAYAPQIRFDAG